MMKKDKLKHTLDRLAIYQIRVPGHLDESWLERAGRITITFESWDDFPHVTSLTPAIDQAALQDLLRRLYSFGLPLISVNCVACD